MGAELARAALEGASVAARGMSFVPPEALEALYWGKASGPAEALAALATELGLDIVFVPAAEHWADDAAGRLKEAGIGVAWTLSGVLGRIAEEEGWMTVLRQTAGDPSALAHPLAEALHEALVEARTGLTRRADAVVVADDLAGAQGWLVSPDFALDALVPCYRSLALEATSAGVPAIFHSDGDIRTILAALSRAGFAGVHPGGLTGDHLATFVRAATAAGLTTLGGLPAVDLMAGAKRLATSARALQTEARLVITDDGGIASAEQLAAFVTAMRAVAPAS